MIYTWAVYIFSAASKSIWAIASSTLKPKAPEEVSLVSKQVIEQKEKKKKKMRLTSPLYK
jgi:1,2-phenylacetyl-CoA epoxidase PaaB subunit